MLLKKFFRFSIPSILSMWIFALYTMVDGLFVSRGVGEYALAAVNLSMPYTIFIFSAGLLMAIGSSTVISIFLGEGKKEKALQVFNQNLAVLAVIGALISLFTYLNLDRIALLLGATDETLDYVKGYLGWISAFAVFFIISYNMEVFVKTDGNPHVQIIGIAACAMVNVVLDYVFVMRLHLGVEGAAIATGIAQVVSTCIFVCYFKFRGKKLTFARFRPDFSVYKRILPLGMADSITEFSGGLVIFLFNHVILRVSGSAGLVSYTVISYVNTLALNCMAGIAQGAQPLISYYYGSGRTDYCHRLKTYALTTAACAGAVFLALSELAPQIPVGLFLGDRDAELIRHSIGALRLYGISFSMVGLNVVSAGFFTAIERPGFSLTISSARSFILLSACLITMTALFGETGIWLSTAVSEGLCLLITAYFYWRYRTGQISFLYSSTNE